MKIKLKLQTKYILAIAFIIICTSLILSFYFIAEQAKIYSSNLKAKGQTLGENFAYSSTYAIKHKDFQVLNDILQGTIQEESVIYAGIIANTYKKNFLAFSSPYGYTPSIIPAYLIRQTLHPSEFFNKTYLINEYTVPKPFFYNAAYTRIFRNIMIISAPIYDKQQVIAFAVVGLTTNIVRNKTIETIKISSIITFYVILIGILISILLTTTITRPIHKLVSCMTKVAEGDYTAQSDINLSDEIGFLAQSFNTMTNNIRSVKEKLANYNTQLEQKVIERTKEIEDKSVKLELALKKSQESERLKSEFLTNISHELRTPLNAIIGFSDILILGQEGNLSKQQQRDLAFINHSGKKLFHLIENILAITTTETKMHELQYEDIDVATFN